jgi:hypothetical protein
VWFAGSVPLKINPEGNLDKLRILVLHNRCICLRKVIVKMLMNDGQPKANFVIERTFQAVLRDDREPTRCFQSCSTEDQRSWGFGCMIVL